jgi:hypothetical protein
MNMGKINKAWHEKHPMPKNPTLDQRVEWHLEHRLACGCRSDLPDSIRKELKRRKIKT